MCICEGVDCIGWIEVCSTICWLEVSRNIKNRNSYSSGTPKTVYPYSYSRSLVSKIDMFL